MKVMQEYLIKKVITSVNKELVYSSLTFNRCYYLLSYNFLKNNLFELWYTALCEKYIWNINDIIFKTQLHEA